MDSGHPGPPLPHLGNMYLFAYFGLFFSLLRRRELINLSSELRLEQGEPALHIN
jgi:hypothetical protein